jgi:hypothetical protein
VLSVPVAHAAAKCRALVPFWHLRDDRFGIERELLDRDDGEGARQFAGAVPAHAVSDEKQVSAFHTELSLLSGRLVCQMRMALVSSALRN